MKYRARYLQFDARGRERKLVSTAFEAPDLISAVRGVLQSLERTQPHVRRAIIGVRIIQTEAPAAAAAPPPPTAAAAPKPSASAAPPPHLSVVSGGGSDRI